MRLIDADALKETICTNVYPVADDFNSRDYGMFWTGGIEKVIDEAPTVDAVPVIRCKDCKHYYEKEWIVGGGSYTTCWYQTIANALPNDYCSRARRRTDDE